MYVSILLAFIAKFVEASTTQGGCGSGFQVCTAPGQSASTPEINTPEFQNLFVDIVGSSLPSSSSSKRSGSFAKSPAILSERASTSLCCNELLSCLTMSNVGIPFCYDRFTTNFVLPDGSSGTVVGGSYQSAAGDTANLETGDFTLANGTTGNIYANNPAAKPNTATLPMPTQFTAVGVGSAVPVSSLGIKVTLTYTTTLPASTLPPKTIPASTIPGIVSTETDLVPKTTTIISGSTVTATFATTSLSLATLPASVVAGTTISGSTVAPIVTVITTTALSSSTSKAKSGAGRGVDSTVLHGGLLNVIVLAVSMLYWVSW